MTGKMRLVDRLRYERNERIDHALFYWTQISWHTTRTSYAGGSGIRNRATNA